MITKHYHYVRWVTENSGSGEPETLDIVSFNLRQQPLKAFLSGIYIGQPTFGLVFTPYEYVSILIENKMGNRLYTPSGIAFFEETRYKQHFGIGGGANFACGPLFVNGLKMPLNLQFTVTPTVFNAAITVGEVMNLELTLEIEYDDQV